MDVTMLRLALKQEPTWPVEMTVVQDGERAILRLLDVTEDKPDFVVLDLNLPRRDGTEVLKTIRVLLCYGICWRPFSARRQRMSYKRS